MGVLARRSGNMRTELQVANPDQRRGGSPDIALRLAFVSSVFKYRLQLLSALTGPLVMALVIDVASPVAYRANIMLVVDPAAKTQQQPGEFGMMASSQGVTQKFVNAEIDLLTNRSIVEDTLTRIQPATIYPDLLNAQAGPQMTYSAAVQSFQSALKIKHTEDSNVIRVTFDHSSPVTAARALNEFVASYQQLHAQVVDSQSGKTEAEKIERDQRNLAALQRARAELDAASGVHDISRQRQVLIQQRDEAEAHLRQTASGVATTSAHIASLTLNRLKVASAAVADDRVAKPARVPQQVGPSDGGLQGPALKQPGRQIEVVGDQSAETPAETTQFSTGSSPLQMAPRLLRQFISGRQAKQSRKPTDPRSADVEGTIAQDLRALDNLKHAHLEPKAPLVVTEPSRQRRARVEQRVSRNVGRARTSGTEPAYLAQIGPYAGSNMVSALIGGVASPEAILRRQEFDLSPVNAEGDPLAKSQLDPVAREQQAAFDDPAGIAAIDRDLFSSQVELARLKQQEIVNDVSIGVIDQQLLHLDQANMQLRSLDFRIAEAGQKPRSTHERRDITSLLDEQNRANLAPLVRASAAAVPETPITPNTSLLLFTGAVIGLLSAMGIVVFVMITSKKVVDEEPLALFLPIRGTSVAADTKAH